MHRNLEDLKIGEVYALKIYGSWSPPHYRKVTISRKTKTRVIVIWKNGSVDMEQIFRLKDGKEIGRDYSYFEGELWEEKHTQHNKRIKMSQKLVDVFSNIRLRDVSELPYEILEEIYQKVTEAHDLLIKSLNKEISK